MPKGEKVNFVIIIIGELLLNVSTLFLIVSKEKNKNEGIYRSILVGIISSIVLNAGLIYLTEAKLILEVSLIVLTVISLFVTLPLVIKNMRVG